MVKPAAAQAQASLPVRVLSSLYGSPERVPAWAYKAWAEGWRPTLLDLPEAINKAFNKENR